MSGLTPTKTFDQILGLDDAPELGTGREMLASLARGSTKRRRDRVRQLEAGRADRRAPRQQPRRRPDHPGGRRASPPPDDRQRDGGDRRSTPRSARPRRWACRSTCSARPGGSRGPSPPSAPTAPRSWRRPRPSSHRPSRGRPRRPSATPTAGPALAGIRLLDFGQYLAGPFGPMVLATWVPTSSRSNRSAATPCAGRASRSSGCQRSKRSLALDLKHPAGLDVAKRLIAGADVVHHNMTRGVATRLGIDYPACRQLRDDIIYCNTYAYGLPDPLGRFGGLDPLYQASSGIEYEAGAVHTGNAPLYLRFGMCDASNAMLSVVGILLALVHRQRTGEGQELWTSLHDGGIIFSSDVWVDADGQPLGPGPPRPGPARPRPRLPPLPHPGRRLDLRGRGHPRAVGGAVPGRPGTRSSSPIRRWRRPRAAGRARRARGSPRRRLPDPHGPVVEPGPRRRRRAQRDPAREQRRRHRAPRRRQRRAWAW